MILPLLAAGLATSIVSEDPSTCGSTVPVDISSIVEIDPSQSAFNRAGSFLSKVVRHCTQAMGAENEFIIMQDILSHLDEAREATGRTAEFRNVINNIKIAAAFGLCHDSTRPDRQEWAMNISQAASLDKVSSATGTPVRNIARFDNGYRWEEGISEWIEKTPVPLVLEHVEFSDEDGEDCLQDDSPTKPWKRARLGTEKQPFGSALPEATKKAAKTPMPRLKEHDGSDEKSRIESLVASINAICDTNQPSPQLEDATQAKAPPLPVLRTSQTANPNNEGDLDELSAPDQPIHQATNENEKPTQMQARLKRQRSTIGITDQAPKRTKMSGRHPLSWAQSQSSLRLEQQAQEVEGGEDELGEG